MTAVFPWVNAIYGLSNQLTFRSYAYYAFQIYNYVVIKDCISGEMFTFVTNLFWIKTYSYGPVTIAIVEEGAFSRIIPQGILEIILFLGGTVCPL